jgi:hypothetical protein
MEMSIFKIILFDKGETLPSKEMHFFLRRGILMHYKAGGQAASARGGGA